MPLKRFLTLGRNRKTGVLSDLELVARFKAGGANQYFEEIFERHWAFVYRIGLSILRDEGLAEDAVQSTFERAYREIHRFDEGHKSSNLRQWLARICRNICLDELRRRKTRMAAMREMATDWTGMPSTAGELLLIREALELLASLEEPYRVCYLLKIQRYSYEEIASMTSYSIEEVKVFIRTAHRNLVRRFERQGT